MSGRIRGPPPTPPPQGAAIPHHFGMVGPARPHLGPHPNRMMMMIEDCLAGQHQEIQALLADNQRLAATHVALKQELEVSQHELQRAGHLADSVMAEAEAQMRELYEKSRQLEAELHRAEAVRAELHRVSVDINDLSATREDLSGKVQMMTRDLARITTDLQQAPALSAEIEAMKKELHRARSAIEYEKKGYAENFEHGQVMESKLISMARELEKLRADVELANSEKKARASVALAAATNPGYPPNTAGYHPTNGSNYQPTNYGNIPNGTAGYAGSHHYPVNYTMNPVQSGNESYQPYGAAPGAWGGAYAQGHMN